MQSSLFDAPVEAPTPAPVATLGEAENKIPPYSRGDLVSVDGRDYRYHRDCGDHAWLAALDANIAGPFYWVKATEVRLTSAHSVSLPAQIEPESAETDRAERLKAAQRRLADLPLNGEEYLAALGDMTAIMREGRRG